MGTDLFTGSLTALGRFLPVITGGFGPAASGKDGQL